MKKEKKWHYRNPALGGTMCQTELRPGILVTEDSRQATCKKCIRALGMIARVEIKFGATHDNI